MAAHDLVAAAARRPQPRDEILEFYAGRLAKWSIPDVLFVEDLPHTATVKLSKGTSPERFKEYQLPTAEAR